MVSSPKRKEVTDLTIKDHILTHTIRYLYSGFRESCRQALSVNRLLRAHAYCLKSRSNLERSSLEELAGDCSSILLTFGVQLTFSSEIFRGSKTNMREDVHSAFCKIPLSLRPVLMTFRVFFTTMWAVVIIHYY